MSDSSSFFDFSGKEIWENIQNPLNEVNLLPFLGRYNLQRDFAVSK